MYRLVILLLCFISLVFCEKASVTITNDEYCLGCLLTVHAYSNVTAQSILKNQLNGVASGESVNGNTNLNLLCDNSFFDLYSPSMKHSCIKLLEDHAKPFLDGFSDSVLSLNTIMSKREIFERNRKICGLTTNVCEISMFKDNVKKKNHCSACKIIATEIEKRFQTAIKKTPAKNVLESTCSVLGYRYQPYLWLEEYCEEMINDHLSELLEIFQLRNAVRNAGMAPSDSVEDVVCKELYPSCYKRKEL